MKNISAGGVMERLRKITPTGIQPKFSNAEEWRAWHAEEGRKRAAEVDKLNRQARAEKILGRTGIQELHRNCTFENYRVSDEGQRKAYAMAKSFAQNFGTGLGSFIFSGSLGTGKNHLAAAIGNHLLQQGKGVLVVTIPDLMLRVRSCYENAGSEASLIDELCAVLNEVGVQRESRGELIILNQVVDRRLSGMKPVGILTNLNYCDLACVLVARIMDRLTMDGGMWVNFDWGSYRKNISHLKFVK